MEKIKISSQLTEAQIEKNAASLGRVWQHVQKENVDSWSMLTSWRSGVSRQENEANFKKLKSTLQSMKLGFFFIEGVGQEEDEFGVERAVSEPSLWVNNISYNDAKKLADKYNQWAFFYSGPEVEDRVAFVSKEGTKYMDKFNPMKIAEFYSRVKGKPFYFSRVQNLNWFEGLARNIESKKNEEIS